MHKDFIYSMKYVTSRNRSISCLMLGKGIFIPTVNEMSVKRLVKGFLFLWEIPRKIDFNCWIKYRRKSWYRSSIPAWNRCLELGKRDYNTLFDFYWLFILFEFSVRIYLTKCLALFVKNIMFIFFALTLSNLPFPVKVISKMQSRLWVLRSSASH